MNEVKIKDQKNDNSSEDYRGWHFSQNTVNDDFKDPRLVTGANAWALNGLAKYITSPLCIALPLESAPECNLVDFQSLYCTVLKSLLAHQSDVTGLFSAGWTVKLLQNRNEDPTSDNPRPYNELLNILGYPKGKDNETYLEIKEHDKKSRDNVKLLDNVRAKNVVTEHNIDMLAVLNFALESGNPTKLGIEGSFVDEIKLLRDNLRRGIFNYLYNESKGYFITGFSEEGSPSIHTAIDNVSWLVLYENLNELKLNPEQVEKLAQSLLFAVQNFVKDMLYEGSEYHGAHYFIEGFEDPYVLRADRVGEIYHIEATTGLIRALKRFCHTFPDHEYTSGFQHEMYTMWLVMQSFVEKHGFLYATGSINGLFEPLQSSTSTIWYIDTYDHLLEDLEQPPEFTSPDHIVAKLYGDVLIYGIKRWGSAGEGPESSITYTTYAKDDDENMQHCPGKASLKIVYDVSKGESDIGGLMICYSGKWRSEGGVGVNLSQYNRLTFYAKADIDDKNSIDNFTFITAVGDINDVNEDDESKDTGTTNDQEIILTEKWNKYEIDISNIDLSNINSLVKIGFRRHTQRNDTRDLGTIWIDDICFEKPSELIFSENFNNYAEQERPKTNQWNLNRSGNFQWEAVNATDKMLMLNTGFGERTLEIKNISIKDFILEYSIRFSSGTSQQQAGVFFRKQNSGKCYVFYLEKGQDKNSEWAAVFGFIENRKFCKIKGSPIGETTISDKTYDIKIEASGKIFHFYVKKNNNFELIMCADHSHSINNVGTIGLRGYCESKGDMMWDNIKLFKLF